MKGLSVEPGERGRLVRSSQPPARCREADGDSVVASKREIDQDDRKKRCKVGHRKVWIEEIGKVGGQ